MSATSLQDPAIIEQQRAASGRRTSIVEGFVQTIGINMGGIYLPNFILTAFLLNVMHASNLLIGFATATQFMVGLMQPIANLVVPKLKRRQMMISVTSTISRLLFCGAIFLGMYWSGPGAEATFMVVLLAGALLMSFSSSGWSTWMADIVPENSRGSYFALRNSVCAVAGILAVLLGGWLAKTFPGTAGFSIIYLICAAATTIGGVLLIVQYEPPQVAYSGKSQAASYKAIFKDRNFMAFVRTVIFFNLALVIAGPFFTVHFLQVLKVPVELMAVLTAAAAVTGILGNFFFGKLSDILGNRFIMRFSMFAMIIPTVLMLFIPATNNLPFVTGIMVFQTFVMAGWNLAAFNSSLCISPRSDRALYIGVYNSLNSVSAILAPLIGGFLIDLYKLNQFPVFGLQFDYTAPVFVVSAVLLVIGLMSFPMYREGNRNEDYSLRDVVLRLDFPEIIYKLFMSSFIPRISQRHKLVEDIVDLRSPAAVVPLERLLRDMDISIRLQALEGLGRTGAAEALEILLDFFPQAGVLERVEVMKSLRHFTADPRVQDILIAETAHPYPTLRIRALVSLADAAESPAVRQLVCSRLRHEAGLDPHPAVGNPGALVDEEYLAYLNLACRSGDPEAITWSLVRYSKLDTELWKGRYLYAWSQATGCQADFYRFLSADPAEDQPAIIEESRAAVMDLLARRPELREVHPFLRREAAEHRYDTQGYLESVRKAVENLLRPLPPAIPLVIFTFLDLPGRSRMEEAFMLMSLRAAADRKD
jgi:MFS family permease